MPQGTSQMQSGWVHGPLTNHGPHQTCPCLQRLRSPRDPHWSEAIPPRSSEPVLRPTPSCRGQSDPTLLQRRPRAHLTEPEPGVSTRHRAPPLLAHQPRGAAGPLHWELAVLTTLRAISPASARLQAAPDHTWAGRGLRLAPQCWTHCRPDARERPRHACLLQPRLPLSSVRTVSC